jgi:hypothetical protein
MPSGLNNLALFWRQHLEETIPTLDDDGHPMIWGLNPNFEAVHMVTKG